MATILNASSSGSGGLVVTGDASGVLQLQSNGTTALTVNADASTTFAQAANLPNTFGFKNRIINGAMVIDQRNAGSAVSISSSTQVFPVDRFRNATPGAWPTAVFSAGQNKNAVTPPSGFKNYLGFATTTADASPAAGTTYTFTHLIEGLNTYDLAWGTASAATVTLSFWVYSNLTGTFGGSITNSAQNRWYPFSYTVSSSNTWTQISITIPGDQTGTWLTTSGSGIQILWSLGCGSTYKGTAGSWGATTYVTVTGEQQVCASTSNYLYITGVQLEKGSTATSFDYRPYGTELALCQRYYAAIGQFGGYAISTSSVRCIVPLATPLRTVPSVSVAATAGSISNPLGANGTPSTISGINNYVNAATVQFDMASSVTLSGATGGMGFLCSTTGSFSSEL